MRGTSPSTYYSSNDLGNYQFTSLSDIISAFEFVYVGEDKLIDKVGRTEIRFHAQRALQEFSFDTLKSIKALEITVPSTLQMSLPQDYVNYVKICRVDTAGIEHVLYPAIKTSNPSSVQQHTEDDFASGVISGDYKFDSDDLDGDEDTTELLLNFESSVIQETTITTTVTQSLSAVNSNIVPGMMVAGNFIKAGTKVVSVNGQNIVFNQAPTAGTTINLTYTLTKPKSSTWEAYRSHTPVENQQDYTDEDYDLLSGERYGLDPQHAQVNGSFYIDELTGKIHFSSNINGKTVILKYISDSLGTEDEMKVHKFAEEAMYKQIAYAVLSGKRNVPLAIVARFKKEARAAKRTAKLRLSNIKLEEITQILRGKSKHIKH
tara:strand:- start:442 stop:1569 length:1128 start_codon:yes stop_codon:yes gene_type:complete